jgi:uncharacterized cupin superfamily protein
VDDGAGGAGVKIQNWFEIEWKDWTEGPAIYHTSYAELGKALGARKLGYHAEILPPKTAICPYHAHFVNEELFVVLGGEPSMRLDGREHRLAAGDFVAIPPGRRGAHQFLNRSDRPAHVFVASTMISCEVVDYPDTGKRLFTVQDLAVDTPAEPASPESNGSQVAETSARALLLEGRTVEYFDGEPPFDLFAGEPLPATEPDPRIVRSGGLAWEPFAMGPFAGERKRIGARAGARLLGYSLYRLAPGQRPWPFHFHHVNEEFFYIRTGYGQLRTADGPRPLKPGDAFACLPGPEGAHAIQNTGDAPLEYLALSTMEQPEIAEYPDSRKVGVMVGAAPGGDPAARSLALAFRVDDAVSDLDGEA